MSDETTRQQEASPLAAASARLEAALERLDETVAARLAAERSGAAPTGADEEVRAALDAARAENERLQSLAATVSQRLDGTIARLRRVLED